MQSVFNIYDEGLAHTPADSLSAPRLIPEGICNGTHKIVKP